MRNKIPGRPQGFFLGSSLPRIFCIHVRSGPIYWGVIYLAKNIIRWWYFTCKKPENIIWDGIWHVNIFHYLKIPYFTCTFFTKFTYNEYIGPYFLSHVVLRFLLVNSPRDFSPITWIYILPLERTSHSYLSILRDSRWWGLPHNERLEALERALIFILYIIAVFQAELVLGMGKGVFNVHVISGSWSLRIRMWCSF